MSKGSSPRPVDRDTFEDNYDLIFGKKPPVYQRKQIDEEQPKEQHNEES